jgi:hypothetical protein
MNQLLNQYNTSFSVIPTLGSRWVFDTKDPFSQIKVEITAIERGWIQFGYVLMDNNREVLGEFVRRSLPVKDFVSYYNPENSDKACANRMGVDLEDYLLFKRDQEEFEQELYFRERMRHADEDLSYEPPI